jgi:hypothetical protein
LERGERFTSNYLFYFIFLIDFKSSSAFEPFFLTIFNPYLALLCLYYHLAERQIKVGALGLSLIITFNHLSH